MEKQFYGPVSNNLLVVKIGASETFLQGILQDTPFFAGYPAERRAICEQIFFQAFLNDPCWFRPLIPT